MRFPAAAQRQRPLRDGTVVDWHDARHVEWPAAAGAKQPGDLRADRDSIDDRRHPNARHRDVSRMNIDYPFHFDSSGRTAATDDEEHIRDMIEQFLFTNPGERVNRPDFGAGLLQLIFAPNSPELASAVQFTIQAGLQRWLSDLVEVRQLQVTSLDSTLRVLVQYVVKRTGEQRAETFVKGSV